MRQWAKLLEDGKEALDGEAAVRPASEAVYLVLSRLKSLRVRFAFPGQDATIILSEDGPSFFQ
jgi:hypothetical protein